jgi:hypothetical protein
VEVTGDGENVFSNLAGFWRQNTVELTQGVLDELSRYMVAGAKHEEDPLAPLRRAMEGIADLAQALDKLEVSLVKPTSEASIRR